MNIWYTSKLYCIEQWAM